MQSPPPLTTSSWFLNPSSNAHPQLYLPFVTVFLIAQLIVIGTLSNSSTMTDPLILWQWMLLFFLLFGATTTFTNSPRIFYMGGREFSQTSNKQSDSFGSAITLALSSFTTWVFAKSVYNASTLGAEFGWVGGLAYTMYYISFASIAFVLYYHRMAGYKSFPVMIHTKYGTPATFAYFLAIAYRLENEIWSNAIVVAGFYGESNSSSYIAALIVGTMIPFIYVMCGGMRMSLYTDVVQAIIALLFLFILLGILGSRGVSATELFDYNPVPTRNMWSLEGGFDLVIVAFLQGVFSYPYFDPVLTDRAFLCPPKSMFWAQIGGGTIAAFYIYSFSFLGVYGAMMNVGGKPQNVSAYISPAFFQFTALIMITSSMSTLDSAFVSTGKALGVEIPGLIRFGKPSFERSSAEMDVRYGRMGMIFMLIVGLLPCIADPSVLNATTLSGTVIMGLSGPVIGGLLVGPRAKYMKYQLPVAFHGSFWCGVILGICIQVGVAPTSFYIGSGKYSLLLGYNLYGLLLCWAFYLVGLIIHAYLLPRVVVAVEGVEVDINDETDSTIGGSNFFNNNQQQQVKGSFKELLHDNNNDNGSDHITMINEQQQQQPQVSNESSLQVV
jgi:Na+/proline symporter